MPAILDSNKKAVSTKNLSLPTEPNKPPTQLLESIIMLYGTKGVGKTSLASKFEDNFTLMFEEGRRNLSIMMKPGKGEPKLDWNTTLGYVELFINDDRYKSMTVDTIEGMYWECLYEVCKRRGCKHPNDKNDYGDTWNAVKAELMALVRIIKESGKGLIFLSHEKTKPLITRTKGLKRDGKEDLVLERIEPSCSKQPFEIIQEVCDYVFYYGYTEEYRTITVRSSHNVCWTSCGVDNTFLDPDGVPLNTFAVGNSANEAYETLLKAYANDGIRDFDWKAPKEKPLFIKKGG